MADLIIIGGGGFGRELSQWIKHINSQKQQFSVLGFLDDDSNLADRSRIPYLGPVSRHTEYKKAKFAIAVGQTKIKKQIVDQLNLPADAFPNLIHPTAIIGDNCKIGEGLVMCPYSILTSDVIVGRHVHLNTHATIGHNASIGDFCTLSSHCDVTGYVSLDEGVFLGTHGSVLPKAKIGAWATVGGMSLAMRTVPPNTTIFGNPGKRL